MIDFGGRPGGKSELMLGWTLACHGGISSHTFQRMVLISPVCASDLDFGFRALRFWLRDQWEGNDGKNLVGTQPEWRSSSCLQDSFQPALHLRQAFPALSPEPYLGIPPSVIQVLFLAEFQPSTWAQMLTPWAGKDHVKQRSHFHEYILWKYFRLVRCHRVWFTMAKWPEKKQETYEAFR